MRPLFRLPPLHKKANKVLQRWRVLAFYRIAPCLNPVCISLCVLPAYTPALNKDRGLDREHLIRKYLLEDFSNIEIVRFLALQHGITISVRTVKQILNRVRLRRGYSQCYLGGIRKLLWFLCWISSTGKAMKTKI